MDLFKLAKGVVLFGSSARGDAGPASDEDYYVVVPDSVDLPFFKRKGKKEFIIRRWSDFVAEFSAGMPLALEIVRDGCVLKGDEEFAKKFAELKENLLREYEFDRWRGIWMLRKNMRRV